MAPRPKRSESELRQASDHLAYEIWMLQGLARGLAAALVGEGIMNNALLESFTIHARALLGFLYADTPRSDDVIAEDFFPSPEGWTGKRPTRPAPLDFVAGRVGKEIAHLTYGRLVVTPETKPWPFLEIAESVSEVLGVFISHVSKDLLGDRWERPKPPQA